MISRYPFYPQSPGSHLIGDIRQYRLIQPTLRTRLQDENVYHLKKKAVVNTKIPPINHLNWTLDLLLSIHMSSPSMYKLPVRTLLHILDYVSHVWATLYPGMSRSYSNITYVGRYTEVVLFTDVLNHAGMDSVRRGPSFHFYRTSDVSSEELLL